MKPLTHPIFITLKRWLTPPVFEGDEDKTRIASHVYFMYELWLIASITFGIILSIVTRNFTERSAAMLAVMVLSFFQMALVRKGSVRLAAILLVCTTWLFINYTVLVTGGVRAVGFGGNLIVVLIAGMLISLNAALIFGFMSIILGLGMAIAQTQGLLPPIPANVNAYTAWLTQGIFLMLITGVLYLTLNDLQQALKRTRLAEARLRGVFENSPDLIMEIDRAEQIIFINRYAEAYLGKNVRSVLPADQIDRARAVIARAFNNGQPQAIELRTITPHGDPSWDSVRIGSVKHGDQISSLTVIITDITAQKDAETALRAREELYRLISTITADYVFSTQVEADGQFHPKWVGGAFESITGFTFEEFVARGGWLASLHPDDRESDARDIEALHANRNTISEVRTFHKSGDMRWVRVYAHPLWDTEHNRLSGIYGAVQDITERKLAEEFKGKLISELEHRNAELERLAYTLSHELKSPLITIRGFLGYLHEDALTGNMKRLETDIKRISDGTEKMVRLINELIDLMSVGRITHEFKEIPLHDLADEAVELVRERIAQRNIVVHIADDLPRVYGDHKLLVEVLQNLLENSAKFMDKQPEPKIEIGQRLEQGGTPIFFVSDNGIGVDPRFHDRIFGIFHKLDVQSEGTGIGLAIVKRIIEVHGGRIWVESEGIGNGTTFCFTIPDGRASAS